MHHTDDEAYELWHKDVGIPPERIYRYGDADNWWGPAGLEGPCGPCSELHYDFGQEFGCGKPMVDPSSDLEGGCHPNHECERIVELWNLVFMQFYQDLEGGRTPLPAPSVDTGMGLERAAIVMQRQMSIYDTDLFQPLVAKASELTDKTYGREPVADYALRVMAEHARASSFLISDGVIPSNEGRGYVLRRIIRRAVRYGRRLGLERPFMEEMASAAIDNFCRAYPDLETKPRVHSEGAETGRGTVQSDHPGGDADVGGGVDSVAPGVAGDFWRGAVRFGRGQGSGAWAGLGFEGRGGWLRQTSECA